MLAIPAAVTAPGRRETDVDVGSRKRLVRRAAQVARVGRRRIGGLCLAEPWAVAVDHAFAITTHDVAGAGDTEQSRRRRAGRANAREDDPHVLDPLADDVEGVQQGGEHDDRRPVLVVVEDRDVELVPKPALDLEAARRRDVLEVDPAEARRKRHNGAHDLVDVLRGEAHRPGVNAAELLEEDRLALHDGESSLRADVAEAEHGRPVGDDRDGVLLHRQRPDLGGVLGDRARNACHARGVGHREVVTGLQRHARRDFQLASEVKQEGSVRDLIDLDSFDCPNGGDDAFEVLGVAGQDRDVPHFRTALDADEVDRPEQSAGLGDRAGEGGERAGVVLEPNAHRRTERRGGVRRRGRVPAGSRRHQSPTVRPAASTSIPSAAGVAGSPGMVIRSPHRATSQPAPV